MALNIRNPNLSWPSFPILPSLEDEPNTSNVHGIIYFGLHALHLLFTHPWHLSLEWMLDWEVLQHSPQRRRNESIGVIFPLSQEPDSPGKASPNHVWSQPKSLHRGYNGDNIPLSIAWFLARINHKSIARFEKAGAVGRYKMKRHGTVIPIHLILLWA